MNNQLMYDYCWDTIDYNSAPVDEQVKMLTDAITKAINDHTPSRKLTYQPGDPNWLVMNPGIKNKIKKRNRLCKRYHQDLETQRPCLRSYEKYRQARKDVGRCIADARENDNNSNIRALYDPSIGSK